MSIEVTLPLKTVSEANQRGHWAKHAKRKREHRHLTKAALSVPLQRGWSSICSARMLEISIVRIAPRQLDGDNLQMSLKAVRDGIADALGTDDRNDRIMWHYGQMRGKPRQYAVRIEVRAR